LFEEKNVQVDLDSQSDNSDEDSECDEDEDVLRNMDIDGEDNPQTEDCQVDLDSQSDNVSEDDSDDDECSDNEDALHDVDLDVDDDAQTEDSQNTQPCELSTGDQQNWQAPFTRAVVKSQYTITRLVRKWEQKNKELNAAAESVHTQIDQGCFQCEKCSAVFTKKCNFDRHSCDATGGNQRKDMLSYASKKFLELVNLGSLDYIPGLDEKAAMESVAWETIDPVDVKPGWAVPLGRGHLYGDNYLDKYRALISDLYQKGADNPSCKMNPAQIRAHIMEKHPGCFDIPSQSQIMAYLSSIHARVKKGKASSQTSQSEGRAKCTSQLVQFMEALPNDLKPKEALSRVQDAVSQGTLQDANLPTPAQIKQKWSYIKSKRKIT
jgi:hypothetical protein